MNTIWCGLVRPTHHPFWELSGGQEMAGPGSGLRMEKEGLGMCWSRRRPAQTEEEEEEGHLGNTVMGLFAEPDEGYLG